MPPEKIDSLADDVKSVVLELLRQNSGLTARVGELVAQNKALLARIAELEAEPGKPPKTPDNSSLPPSRSQKGRIGSPLAVCWPLYIEAMPEPSNKRPRPVEKLGSCAITAMNDLASFDESDGLSEEQSASFQNLGIS